MEEPGGLDLILPGGAELFWGSAIGLLFLALPVAVGYTIARNRGLNPVPAIALGIFGGPLGMLIVWAYYRPARGRRIEDEELSES